VSASDPWERPRWDADTGLVKQVGEQTSEPPGPPPSVRRPAAGLLVWIGAALCLLSVGLCTVLILVTGDETKQRGPIVRTTVEATGQCRTNIVGRYSVLATVTVHNATSTEQRGTVYARWPVTGSEPLVFAQEWTLAPGQTKSFHVDEAVDAERWYRLEACDHGWSATGVPSP
jgi:hypothetical protein